MSAFTRFQLAPFGAPPWRVTLAVVLIALAASAFIVEAALERGARAQAFRVAIIVGEGDLTILPEPGGTDAPAMISDAGPLYTQPALMRSGAVVAPRVTLPVHISAGHGDDLAILHGVERQDPQAALLLDGHLTGTWPEKDEAAVVLGADLAASSGVKLGSAVMLRLARPDASRVPARVVGLLRTGREDWDAHGLWSPLALARAVRGLRHPRDSEAVTHLAVFLADPTASGEWRDRIQDAGLPDFTEVREWWQMDLEPLRFAPQADRGVPWATAMLAMLLIGLAANLLLGPAPLPPQAQDALARDQDVRVNVLLTIGTQGVFLALLSLALAALLVLMLRNGSTVIGAFPADPRWFLPPAAAQLGTLLSSTLKPGWDLGDVLLMGAVTVVCIPLAATVRLWRISGRHK